MAIEDDVLVIGGGLAGTTAALAATERDGDASPAGFVQAEHAPAREWVDRRSRIHAGGRRPARGSVRRARGLPDGHPYERVGSEAVRDALEFLRRYRGRRLRRGPHRCERARPDPRRNGQADRQVSGLDRRRARERRPRRPDRRLRRRCRTSKRRWRRPTSRRQASLRGPRRHGSVPRHRSRRRENHPVRAPARPRRSVATTFGETTAAPRRSPRPFAPPRGRVPRRLPRDPRRRARRRGQSRLADRLGRRRLRGPDGATEPARDATRGSLYDALEERASGDDGGSGGRLRDRRGRDGPERSRTDRSRRRRPERQRDSPPRRPVRARDGRTGRKGRVRSERERVFEPIFDCHVPHAADRYDWFVDDVFGDQPYARFGLPVDRDLRPLDASDEPEFRTSGRRERCSAATTSRRRNRVPASRSRRATSRAGAPPRRANDERRRVRLERRNRPTARTRSGAGRPTRTARTVRTEWTATTD